jgi:hypothetical protein
MSSAASGVRIGRCVRSGRSATSTRRAAGSPKQQRDVHWRSFVLAERLEDGRQAKTEIGKLAAHTLVAVVAEPSA